jgi:TRAP-type uncharacterized transport system substrate-binding protein
VTNHLNRPLAPRAPARKRHLVALAEKIGAVVVVLAVLAAIASQLNVHRDLHRLRASMLSGAPEGNYHRVVGELAELAATEKGALANVASDGSVDNVARLRAAKGSCDAAFALVQDGTDFGPRGELELLARLPRSESVFLFARADRAASVTKLGDLANAKIGVGPAKSGSAVLASQIFALPDLATLGVKLSNHELKDEPALVGSGQLDFALVVMDEDAPWIIDTMRKGEVGLAALAHVDAIARRLPHFRVGRIGAGEFDAVRLIPPEDRRVLRVETLVVGNRCASRSATLDLMVVLARRFPDLIRHNKESANTSGLDLAPAARGFFEHEGPEVADEYAPWLVDVMPPANWAYVVMAVSLLFNAMGFGHRFRLWRIDAARVHLESEIGALFGPTTTLGDIARKAPEAEKDALAQRARVEEIVRELEALAARSRKQSLSVLVPMGQEMAYRYQESVIYETLAVLRDFLRRAEYTPERS